MKKTIIILISTFLLISSGFSQPKGLLSPYEENILWSHKVKIVDNFSLNQISKLYFYNNLILFGATVSESKRTGNFTIFAIDINTGKQIWQHKTGYYNARIICRLDDSIIIAKLNRGKGIISSINIADNKTLWETNFSYDNPDFPANIYKNIFYCFDDHNKHFQIINLSTGEKTVFNNISEVKNRGGLAFLFGEKEISICDVLTGKIDIKINKNKNSLEDFRYVVNNSNICFYNGKKILIFNKNGLYKTIKFDGNLDDFVQLNLLQNEVILVNKFKLYIIDINTGNVKKNLELDKTIDNVKIGQNIYLVSTYSIDRYPILFAYDNDLKYLWSFTPLGGILKSFEIHEDKVLLKSESNYYRYEDDLGAWGYDNYLINLKNGKILKASDKVYEYDKMLNAFFTQYHKNDFKYYEVLSIDNLKPLYSYKFKDRMFDRFSDIDYNMYYLSKWENCLVLTLNKVFDEYSLNRFVPLNNKTEPKIFIKFLTDNCIYNIPVKKNGKWYFLIDRPLPSTSLPSGDYRYSKYKDHNIITLCCFSDDIKTEYKNMGDLK